MAFSFQSVLSIIVLISMSGAASAAGFADDFNRVIYGQDDREDPYASLNTVMRAKSLSTVALFRNSKVDISADGKTATLQTETFGEANSLCSSERFYFQKKGAFCSGTLIAPNVVMTAGHCITSSYDCSATRLVFGFAQKSSTDDPSTVPASEVYSCKTVLSRGDTPDYALIELDRPVENHEPLEVDFDSTPAVGTPVAVIGHPAGLPTKITDGASIRSVSSGEFIANLDTYGGNSGSAVFNEDNGKIIGILVRGDTDFVRAGYCMVSNTCTSSGCAGEDSTRMTAIKDALMPLFIEFAANTTNVSISDGTANVRVSLNLKGKIQDGEDLEIIIKSLDTGGGVLESVRLPELALGKPQTFDVAISGLDLELLAHQGARIQVELRKGTLVLALKKLTLRAPYDQSIIVAKAPMDLNILQGHVSMVVKVSNAGRKVSRPLAMSMSLAGKTAQVMVENLEAGESRNVLLELSDIDPLTFFDQGLAALHVVGRDHKYVFHSSQNTVLGSDKDLLGYFVELIDERSVSDDNGERVQKVISKLADKNATELRSFQAARITAVPSTALIRRIVEAYQIRSQSIEADVYFKQLGGKLWDARVLLKKRWFVKTSLRKSYERLCKSTFGF